LKRPFSASRKKSNSSAKKFVRVAKGSGAEPGTSPTRCSTCNGQGEVRQVRQTILGQMMQTAVCPTCGGRGEVIHRRVILCRGGGLERKRVMKKVQNPAGCRQRHANPFSRRGRARSLLADRMEVCFCCWMFSRINSLKRRENDILLNLDVNIAQATLGAEVDVPTLDGDEKFKDSGRHSTRQSVSHQRQRRSASAKQKSSRRMSW